ncbi:uronyl 2-sulfotransferase-like isoform X2 [Apostichopus japonicus]|uniref:uronyl 2-sulfotransferase-like isoform X2 n=1 Tax=Stichopus japonicus TaxID=307972 RepID=UPI003AB1900F
MLRMLIRKVFTKSLKTSKGKNFIILYNAIPKTGSRSLDNAMIHVAKRWPNLISFRLIPPAAFDDAERLDTFLSHRKIPSFVRGHAMYTECKGGPEIVYINTVRDPVERVISNYYFDLFGDTAAKNASHGGDNWPETIDECLKMTSHTCNDAITYYTKVTLRQFCGMDERCKIVNEWTLSRAKRNLQQYTIVGLSSEIGTTIKALQILLPDMFKDVDIYALYSRHQNDSIAFTKTNVKHSPRPETIKLLRERMDLQYEFFDYVKTRYSKLKRDLRID